MPESQKAKERRLQKDRERARKARETDPQKLRDRYRKWRLANPDKVYNEKRRAQIRDWAKKNPGKRREYKFGLTQAAFEAVLETQNFHCAGCTADLRLLPPKHVHVDHCHESGQVRGILCHPCNTSLGLMKERIESLQGLIDYIRRFK